MKTPMLFTLHSVSSHHHPPFASINLVDNTCKKTPDTNFCAQALRSNPRSSTTDTKALALIMVDKVDANAKSTLTEIEHLRSKALDPKTKEGLYSCEKWYRVIIVTMAPAGKDSLMKGNYKSASEYMNSAGFGTFGCEMAFGVSMSPISDLNDYESKVATVAGAIACLLP